MLSLVREWEKAGADVVGSNCGNGLDNMVAIAEVFVEKTSGPIMIQSNAGEPVVKKSKLIYPESPGYFAQKVPRLLDIGVSIIGGCCGTTPEVINIIRQAVDSRKVGLSQ